MRDSRTSAENLPVKQGALVGGVIWIVGVVVFTVFISFSVPISQFLFGILAWFVVHLWPFVHGGDTNAVILAMSVVPMASLTYGGYYVASHHGGGARGGATLVAGYLPLAVLSFAYVAYRIREITAGIQFGEVPGAGSFVTPETFVMLLFTGILMPGVFGAIGGKLAE